MKEFYISFGQLHAHSISGITFDKNCIAIIKADTHNEAHRIAIDIFKGVFAFVYDEMPDMSFFPKGLIEIV